MATALMRSGIKAFHRCWRHRFTPIHMGIGPRQISRVDYFFSAQKSSPQPPQDLLTGPIFNFIASRPSPATAAGSADASVQDRLRDNVVKVIKADGLHAALLDGPGTLEHFSIIRGNLTGMIFAAGYERAAP